MPGLTLWMTTGAIQEPVARFGKAQAAMLHMPHYAAVTWLSEPGFCAGHVAYPEYPTRTIDVDVGRIYLEGRIYAKSTDVVEAELLELAQTLATNPENAVQSVEPWATATEGEYLVAIAFPARQLLVLFSDPFGRLPLYFHQSGEMLLVAREPKFIQALKPSPCFDRVGWAEQLALGLTVGRRTLFKNVESFPDAGLMVAQVRGGRIRTTVRQYRTWNLDETHTSGSVQDHARTFAERFVEACGRWGNHPDASANVVSLSGGHDSRMVVVGLAAAETNVVAATYRDPNGRREGEVRCARELTERLGVPWHLFEVPPPVQDDFERILRLKDGMNWASMAYILNYHEQVAKRWGRDAVYFTGDGGDDCTQVTAPVQRFASLDEVVDHVLQHLTCMLPDLAEAIMRLDGGTLRDEVRDLFDTYPEHDLRQRVSHYRIFERGRRCYFEGEDRARFFLWQASPFYSLEVYEYAMRIPDRMKRYNEFCRRALAALSPSAARVPIYPIRSSPASLMYRIKQRGHAVMPRLPKPLARLIRLATGRTHPAFQPPDVARTYLESQLLAGSPLADVVSPAHALHLLGESSADAFYQLWTLALLEGLWRQEGWGVS